MNFDVCQGQNGCLDQLTLDDLDSDFLIACESVTPSLFDGHRIAKNDLLFASGGEFGEAC